MINRRFASIAAAVVCAFICVFPLWAADEQGAATVTTEGVAFIQDGNLASARDGAIGDALRKAVEQAVGTMVSAQTIAENYTVLSDRVYSRTAGYVKGYEVLSEANDGDFYKVRVRAQVSGTKIKDDLSALGLLLARKGMPRVIVMVAEQNIGRTYYVYWWNRTMTERTEMNIAENTIVQKLSQKGFNVVDHSGDVSLSDAYRIVDLSDDAVRKVGSLYGADIVVYGKALARLRGSVLGSSMQSVMANISLRAVNTDNGSVIASVTASAPAAHPDEVTAGINALKAVAEQAADELISQVTERWSSDVSNAGLVQVALSGDVTYDRLVSFKERLKGSVTGVKNIYQRSFENGSALLDVEFAGGSAQQLADSLAGLSLDGFSVKVTGVAQNSIRAEVLAGPPGY